MDKTKIDGRLRQVLSRRAYDAVKGVYYAARDAARRGPGHGRLMPDFLIIGSRKCATTSLHGWLCEHPLVAPAEKEIFFFNIHYYRRPDWYRTHFPTVAERDAFAAEHGRPFLVGDATPSYMEHYWTPQRAAKLLPEARLIVCLRDPVDRAHSQFHHYRRRGTEPLETFEEAIAAEPERLAGEAEHQQRDPHFHSWRIHRWGYLATSRYAEQLERWFAVYPRERFLFLDFDEVAADPAGALARVHAHLGLPDHPREDFPALNSGRYEPLAADTRARLREYFAPHDERLRELTGREFAWMRA